MCVHTCMSVCVCVCSPSSPSPVTQQMTAMSISQDTAATDSDRAEEDEDEGSSKNTGLNPDEKHPHIRPRVCCLNTHKDPTRPINSPQTWTSGLRVCVCVLLSRTANVCSLLAGPGGEAGQVVSDGDQTPDKNKKKNRCFTCRKKVGLTGERKKNQRNTVVGRLLPLLL